MASKGKKAKVAVTYSAQKQGLSFYGHILARLTSLTGLIANLPSCTNHTIMAADREVESDCFPGAWGTNAAAY